MNIELIQSGYIAKIILTNPDRHNALNADDVALFKAYLDEVTANSECRVVIIGNDGGNTFCAGASLPHMLDGSMNGELYSTLTNKVADMAIPTIAMINGNAYGGGAELGLCCDFRVGSDGMRLFVPPARIGLCYPLDGIKRFVSVLGVTVAKKLLLAAQEFSGSELYDCGYLTHKTTTNDIVSFAESLATSISSLAPLAVKTMKQLCDQHALGQIDLAEGQRLIDECNRSADLVEGLTANAEKRSAVFTGK